VSPALDPGEGQRQHKGLLGLCPRLARCPGNEDAKLISEVEMRAAKPSWNGG